MFIVFGSMYIASFTKRDAFLEEITGDKACTEGWLKTTAENNVIAYSLFGSDSCPIYITDD